MNKWEALVSMVLLVGFFGMIASMSYNEERIKQYRIQYNCPK